MLGWYHSHPIFEVNPSNIDIDNQKQQQDMFFNDNEKPFVGFIVGPYWQNVMSDLRCFYVLKQKPYEININIIPEESIRESTFK